MLPEDDDIVASNDEALRPAARAIRRRWRAVPPACEFDPKISLGLPSSALDGSPNTL